MTMTTTKGTLPLRLTPYAWAKLLRLRDLGDTEVKENELKMAVQLAEMSASDAFHPEQYRDEVQDRVRGMIQKKIEGEEITSIAEEEPRAQVIDLMEALRASLERKAPAPKADGQAQARKPPKRSQSAQPAQRKAAKK